MGIETFKKNEFGDNDRAIEQDQDRKNGGYGGDYYDENEHRAGQEKRDLSTGKPIKNDGGVKTPHGLVIDKEGKLVNLAEGLNSKQKKLQDMADELLKQYGSDEFGIEPPKEDKKAA